MSDAPISTPSEPAESPGSTDGQPAPGRGVPAIPPKLAALIVVLVVAIGACVWSLARGGTGSTPSSPETSATSSVSATAGDRAICGSLSENGDGFYRTFRALMLRGGRSSENNLTLAGQLRTVARVGDNLEDLDAASPDVRRPATSLAREADRMAAVYSSTVPGTEDPNALTATFDSYVSLLVACTKVGLQPSWFDPAELTGH